MKKKEKISEKEMKRTKINRNSISRYNGPPWCGYKKIKKIR